MASRAASEFGAEAADAVDMQCLSDAVDRVTKQPFAAGCADVAGQLGPARPGIRSRCVPLCGGDKLARRTLAVKREAREQRSLSESGHFEFSLIQHNLDWIRIINNVRTLDFGKGASTFSHKKTKNCTRPLSLTSGRS